MSYSSYQFIHVLHAKLGYPDEKAYGNHCWRGYIATKLSSSGKVNLTQSMNHLQHKSANSHRRYIAGGMSTKNFQSAVNCVALAHTRKSRIPTMRAMNYAKARATRSVTSPSLPSAHVPAATTTPRDQKKPPADVKICSSVPPRVATRSTVIAPRCSKRIQARRASMEAKIQCAKQGIKIKKENKEG